MMLYVTYLVSTDAAPHEPHPVAAPIVIVGVVCFGLLGWRLWSLMKTLRSMRLGFEAELAAGEEINRLMRRGCWIFHDVPGEKSFNVDHVVVTRKGVFAIETKGRPKMARGSGRKGSSVSFDGGCLRFPGWIETRPIEQARANAVWLSRWLTKAVGADVAVSAVVLLPGWWVERTGRGDVAVGNAKEIEQIVERHADSRRMTDQLCAQIVHQLDQRCRNLQPKAFAD